MGLELIKPNKDYLESYYQACVESYAYIHDPYIMHNPTDYSKWKETIFEDYRKQEIGDGLLKGFVPNITYWAIDNEYIGTVNIRLKLTDKLLEYGGLCGVAIRKSARGKGYALTIVKKALDIMSMLKVCPLFTCEETNIASWKTLEHLPYKKKDLYITEINGKQTSARRYWF